MKIPATAAAFLLLTAIGCTVAVAAAEKEPALLKANPNQEIDVLQNSEGVRVHLHVSSKYFSAYVQTYEVFIFGQAPDWDIYESSPAKKLFCKMKLANWLKRGTPLNFFSWVAFLIGQQSVMDQPQLVMDQQRSMREQRRSVTVRQPRRWQSLAMRCLMLPARIPLCQYRKVEQAICWHSSSLPTTRLGTSSQLFIRCQRLEGFH